MICEHCKKIIEQQLPLSEKIMRVIAWEHQLTPRILKSRAKAPEIVAARRRVWWEMSIVNRWSLPVAGRVSGGFDHTTVLHGIRKLAQERYGMPFRSGLEDIRRAWVLDPDSHPLVEIENNQETGEAA